MGSAVVVTDDTNKNSIIYTVTVDVAADRAELAGKVVAGSMTRDSSVKELTCRSLAYALGELGIMFAANQKTNAEIDAEAAEKKAEIDAEALEQKTERGPALDPTV